MAKNKKRSCDMNEYYKITAPDDVAIILQNDKVEVKAKMIEGFVYLDFDTVSKVLNNRFYNFNKIRIAILG